MPQIKSQQHHVASRELINVDLHDNNKEIVSVTSSVSTLPNSVESLNKTSLIGKTNPLPNSILKNATPHTLDYLKSSSNIIVHRLNYENLCEAITKKYIDNERRQGVCLIAIDDSSDNTSPNLSESSLVLEVNSDSSGDDGELSQRSNLTWPSRFRHSGVSVEIDDMSEVSEIDSDTLCSKLYHSMGLYYFIAIFFVLLAFKFWLTLPIQKNSLPVYNSFDVL